VFARSAFATVAAGASAASFTNGSFEDGPDAGSFLTLNGGDTSIAGWVVGDHSVDYIGSYWQSSHGENNVDLDGNGLGSISQTFDTIAGTLYTVKFDMSGNPDGPPVIKPAKVRADSQTRKSS